MRISNAKLFVDGAFIEGGIEFEKTITALGNEVTGGEDAHGCYLIPGMLDIHTHAAVGADASDGDPEGMITMSRYYAHEGVTAWLPTTMTLKEPVLTKAMEVIRDFERPEDGARVAGINLEGPFLCYSKRGAQAAENLHAPDVAMFKRLNAASGNQVKLVTVAPEEPGAIPFIEEVSKICTVSIGHSAAGIDAAEAGYKAGASHATHLYNGMPSLHHREPGVIGAASDAGATAELIVDGFHVHPSAVRLTHRLFGKNLVLISDSLRCAGMPDGDYELGGQPITMKNGKATLTGTDTLAGSSIHLIEAVRRAVAFGISLEDAVYAATYAPAKAIRCEDTYGVLAKDRMADFVLLDENLQVQAVYIDGVKVR